MDVDGASVATLNAGQFYETILTSASSVTANNPIQVMQYSNGESYDDADADPMDITIPPTEQFLNSYTVTTEPDGADPAITQNYLNIVAPTSEVSSIDWTAPICRPAISRLSPDRPTRGLRWQSASVTTTSAPRCPSGSPSMDSAVMTATATRADSPCRPSPLSPR